MFYVYIYLESKALSLQKSLQPFRLYLIAMKKQDKGVLLCFEAVM